MESYLAGDISIFKHIRLSSVGVDRSGWIFRKAQAFAGGKILYLVDCTGIVSPPGAAAHCQNHPPGGS